MKKMNVKEKKMLKQLAKTLKIERNKRKLKLEDVKCIIDLSIATISKFENGEPGQIATFIKYANSLGFDIILQKREENNNNN